MFFWVTFHGKVKQFYFKRIRIRVAIKIQFRNRFGVYNVQTRIHNTVCDTDPENDAVVLVRRRADPVVSVKEMIQVRIRGV